MIVAFGAGFQTGVELIERDELVGTGGKCFAEVVLLLNTFESGHGRAVDAEGELSVGDDAIAAIVPKAGGMGFAGTKKGDFDVLLDTAAAEEVNGVTCAGDGFGDVALVGTAAANEQSVTLMMYKA